MGHQRQSLAPRYRYIAWLALTRWVLLAAAGTCLALAYFQQDPAYLLPAGICGASFLGIAVIFMIEASQVRCMMCRAFLLRSSRCARHPGAKRFFGSTTMRTTIAIAVSPSKIRCQYCGGRFRLAGKKYHRRRSSSGRPAKSHQVSDAESRPAARRVTALPPRR